MVQPCCVSPLQSLETSFLALVREHQRIIHKVCRMYADDADDRQDLFQEVVLQLWRAFPSFRGDAKITTWLYRVALNVAISDLRKKKARPEPDKLNDQFINIKDDTVQAFQDENVQLLYKAIEHLSQVEKALVMLYLEEHSYDEIAEIMGITANNARVKMHRLQEKLRKIMATIS
ncbi:MAG: sigma-70 family RNA polymerase sigma factor [Bacteroidetes bacterium]|nr:MAG: sigma-70 family RNA polymerase sigma factor [Bacteroidota bacterium]